MTGRVAAGLLCLLTAIHASPALGDETAAVTHSFFELYDVAGKLFRLKHVAGEESVKMIAVDFFWDGCKPCKEALPKWTALHEKYRDKGLRIVIVDVRAGDDIATARKKLKSYFKEHPVPYPVVFDKYNIVAREYGVVAADNSVSLPQVFLLSPEGKQLLKTPRCGDAETLIKEQLK